ncbi:allantoate amidohydrolase [Phenylobacterium sp. LjRoot225]|uniref:allantoate amidohydrolase n=1 Tax=Phenylobacterium sp. LjRoot225 TaxID=3342285 RepID=UPI003ECF309B
MPGASRLHPDAAASPSGGGRAVERCRLLSRPPYSDTPEGLYRAYLTPAHAAARDKLAEWMAEAGLETRVDPAGNLVGRYPASAAADAPVLLIGSHIDSVRDAGAFDGPLGVMLGVECVGALHARGLRLPFAIEVIAFGDEEGSRFPAAMLTSRAVAGTLDPQELDIGDDQGVTLADALAGFGLDKDRFASARRRQGSVLAYFEAHIEQGPTLEAEGLALGVVTSIAGQRRFSVTLTGAAGHAGTSSMTLRRDALAAAAEAVLAIERIARDGPADLVATVGRLAVAPGAANVIPGRVDFTIDVRAGGDADRDAAAGLILEALSAIAASRAVGLEVQETHVLAASPCDPALTDRLAEAVAATGQAPRRLVSGAGHDAMVMAALAPTAMLFIRCAGGISHNPLESVDVEDAERSLQAMLLFIEGLAA